MSDYSPSRRLSPEGPGGEPHLAALGLAIEPALGASRSADERGQAVPPLQAIRRKLLNRLKRGLRGPDLHRLEHLVGLNGATYIGDNRVLVRVTGGDHTFAFYVHADDKLLSPWIIITGQYEPTLTEHIVNRLRPDSNCIDVGSNFGYYTCLMSKHCPRGRTIGIEPNRSVYELAVDNVLINVLQDRTEIVHAAIGDQEGEMVIHERIGRSGNSSIAPAGEAFTTWMAEPPERTSRVRSTRLDSLLDRLSGRVDVIKVDVEGAEPLVLAGARDLVARNPRLTIFMEWSPGQIRHAGFDVPQFCEDLALMGLHAHAMTENSLELLSATELANLPYQPAVMLSRRR